MQFDVAVVGAGLAASAFLISLKGNGLKIIQIAPPLKQKFKIGETLSGNAARELKQLGLYDSFLQEVDLLSGRSFSSWGTPLLVQRHPMQMAFPSWQLDRIQFEHFIQKKADPAITERLFDKVLSADRNSGRWELTTQAGIQIAATFMVDGSGRAAVMARQHAKRERFDKLVAAYLVTDQTSADVIPTPGTMVEAVSNGWWYSALIPACRLVVSFFTDSDLLPSKITQETAIWKALLHRSHFTLKRLETAGFTIDTTPKVVDASTILTKALDQPGLITAGDAAVSFDPLSSFGMTTALWSGRKAALSVLGLLGNNDQPLLDYQDKLDAGVKQYFQQKKAMYRMEQRFFTQEFWKRRR